MNEPTCGDCGQELTLVRPGKHQCDNPNCVQNNSKPESVPSQQAKIHKSEIVQKVLDNITPEEMAETERKMMEESVPSCGETEAPVEPVGEESLIFTEQEMIDCFTAGVSFGRNMMSNPSNSEYLEIIKNIKRNGEKRM